METENENDALLAVRLPKLILAAAKRRAAARDESLSQVVRRALRDYIAAAEQADLFDKPRASKKPGKKSV